MATEEITGGPASTTDEDSVENTELYKAFLARDEDANASTDPDASATTASDGEDEGAGEGVPEAPSSPSSAQPTDDTDETSPQAGDEAGDEEDETEEDDDVEAPAEEAPSSFTIDGRNLTEGDMRQVLQVADWASSLSPDQVNAIDAVLSGEYEIVPRGAAASVPQPGAAAPGVDDDDEYDDLDPKVKARLDHLTNTVETLSKSQSSVFEEQQRRVNEEVVASIRVGASKFQTATGLTDDEREVLTQRVVQLQILPGYANQYRGDPATAMEKAMEAVYWQTPEYREREVQKQLAQERKTTSKETTRKTKASSLTSGGGSVPRVEPSATKDQRREQMKREIEEAMK